MLRSLIRRRALVAAVALIAMSAGCTPGTGGTSGSTYISVVAPAAFGTAPAGNYVLSPSPAFDAQLTNAFLSPTQGGGLAVAAGIGTALRTSFTIQAPANQNLVVGTYDNLTATTTASHGSASYARFVGDPLTAIQGCYGTVSGSAQITQLVTGPVSNNYAPIQKLKLLMSLSCDGSPALTIDVNINV